MLCRNLVIGAAAWLGMPGSAFAQEWRQVVPPAPSGAFCSDTTHGRLLMVGVLTGPGPWGSLLPGTWWFDGSGFELAAPANQGPVGTGLLVHDSVRGRNVYLEPGAAPETWEHDGIMWTQVTTATQPTLTGGDMVFASSLGVVVAVGDDGSTWHYDGVDWAQQSPAVSPPARFGFALGFDPSRSVVVLQGGRLSSTQSLQDTWEYDGVTWSQRSPTTVPPAAVGRMAFDAALGVMVARFETGSMFDWDWMYDGNDWSQIPTVFGSYPWTHRMVTSPISGRVWWLVSSNGYLGEELHGAAWLPIAGAVGPSPRYGGGIAVDPLTDTLVMFGGCLSDPGYPDDEQWIRSGATWFTHQLNPRPSPRVFPVFVHDTARDRFILFGGYDGSQRLRDTWSFANGQWQWLSSAGPTVRERAAAAYDPVRERIVMFGGNANSNSPLGDLWIFDGATWSQVNATGGPSPRYGAAMTYDAANDRMVLFGGATASGSSSETWYLDGTNWTLLTAAVTPTARSGACLAYDPFGGDVVMVGGRDGGTTLSDCWELRDDTWVSAASQPPAVPRFGAQMVAVPARARMELYRGALVSSFLGQPFGRAFHDQSYRECGAAPRIARHGVGCDASAGAVDLAPAPGSLPAIGATFVLELGNLPAPSLSWLALGTRIDHWQGAALPFDLGVAGLTGCHLWVAPTVLEPAQVTGTVGSVAVAIPALPALSGSVLGAQGIVLDASAPNGVGAVSNAIVATIR